MRYCEDMDCPNLGGEIGSESDCQLGFDNRLRVPRCMHDAVYGNWGHKMPKACRKHKFRLVKGKLDAQVL